MKLTRKCKKKFFWNFIDPERKKWRNRNFHFYSELELNASLPQWNSRRQCLATFYGNAHPKRMEHTRNEPIPLLIAMATTHPLGNDSFAYKKSLARVPIQSALSTRRRDILFNGRHLVAAGGTITSRRLGLRDELSRSPFSKGALDSSCL